MEENTMSAEIKYNHNHNHNHPVKSGEQNHHPPEPENLQCPRCESTNTKFCYYNNYNLSQPRYFCKSCRRYWTRGGSLRNIPVGGGTRKNNSHKRPRVSPSSPSLSAAVKAEPTTPQPTPAPTMNLNEALPGSFSSLLGAQNPGNAFLGLGGFGVGLGPGSGFDMLGFEFGPAMGEVGKGGPSNTWQMDGGDIYGWPDLAISTPGTAGLE